MSNISASPAGATAHAPAAIFAALGDQTRLSLIHRLSDGRPRSIASLSADTAITRQAVTKHLNVLEEVGLVASSRIGRESRYSFRPETIEEIRAYLDEVSRQWDDALGRLKSFVEG
jgi:DNA-binding transcriptional ArsR family regulator